MTRPYAREIDLDSHNEMGEEISRLQGEVDRLRAALRECAALYRSPPCTVPQGYQFLAAEFVRRMEVAFAALHPAPTAGQE